MMVELGRLPPSSRKRIKLLAVSTDDPAISVYQHAALAERLQIEAWNELGRKASEREFLFCRKWLTISTCAHALALLTLN